MSIRVTKMDVNSYYESNTRSGVKYRKYKIEIENSVMQIIQTIYR